MYVNHNSSHKQYCRFLIEKIVRDYVPDTAEKKAPRILKDLGVTYKVVIDKRRKNTTNIYPVRLRVYKNQRTTERATGIKVHEKDWDEHTQSILDTDPNYEKNIEKLQLIKEKVKKQVDLCKEEDLEVTPNILINRVSTNTRGKINVFTLPSTNFMLEQSLCNIDNVSLFCAEFDSEVYKQQLGSTIYQNIKKIKNNDFVLVKEDAFQAIRSTTRKYNILWVDLCGNITSSLVNNLISLIQGQNLSNNSYLALTILKGRETKIKTLSNFYGYKSVKSFRENGIQDILGSFAQEVGRSCELINRYNYRDASPMSMYIFNIKKNK